MGWVPEPQKTKIRTKTATRPKTSSPRWSGGDFPICQSLSPIPAIVATSPENRGGVRQDQQEGNESDDQQEQAHEDVHVLDEDRGSDEPDHEEEHPGVSDRGSPHKAEVLPRDPLVRGLGSRVGYDCLLMSTRTAPTNSRNSPITIAAAIMVFFRSIIMPLIIGGGGACIQSQPQKAQLCPDLYIFR